MRHALVALLALFLLNACDSTQSLQELRTAAPAEDPYRAALAAGYKQFAEEKLADYDWSDSSYFADKGLMAAYGRDVEPEDAANWSLPESAQTEAVDARKKLIEAVTATKATQPKLAADAVVAYDRWLTALHNGANATDIAETHEAFFATIGKLVVAQVAEPGVNAPSSEPGVAPAAAPEPVPAPAPISEPSPGHAPAPEPEAAVAPAAAPVATPAAPAAPKLATILYFPFDSDTLGGTANEALSKLVSTVKPNSTITINGHTDRVGSEAYNLSLSERRSKSVVQALIHAGVNEKFLQFFAFGESDPAIPTADGVAEQRNRRVEILTE